MINYFPGGPEGCQTELPGGPSSASLAINLYPTDVPGNESGIYGDIMVLHTYGYTWALPPGGMEGTCPPGSKFRGTPPEIAIFKRKFSVNLSKFSDFPIFSKLKWPKSGEKSEFGGRWF